MNKITIIGGGNIGTLMAANIASKEKYQVTLLTSNPSNWSESIKVYDGENRLLRTGRINSITNDPKKAFENADIIICTLPSNIYHEVIHGYLQYIPEKAYFGVIPGMGGKEFPVLGYSKTKIKYFAFQRVPGVARIIDYGKSVADLGERDLLHFATRNVSASATKDLKLTFEDLFGIKCDILPNVLCVTLTPSNPILHTSRLYGLGKIADNNVFTKDYLFYKDWDNISSEIILGMDHEVQLICNAISGLDLSTVKSLTEHYGANTVEKFTEKISSIKSLSTIKSPLIKKGENYVFDFSSRYFNEDFYFGLYIIDYLAKILNIEAFTINEVVNWHKSLIIDDNPGMDKSNQIIDLFKQSGITDLNSIISLYK